MSGYEIRTKPATPEYREGHDRIFGKRILVQIRRLCTLGDSTFAVGLYGVTQEEADILIARGDAELPKPVEPL